MAIYFASDWIKNKYFLCFSLGYGIPEIDKPTTHGHLCGLNYDTFTKEKETVFQLKMQAVDQHRIKAREWEMYTDVTSEKSGFICEKEGNNNNFSLFGSTCRINFIYTC